MRAADLTLSELIHFDEASGIFRFVGQRSIVVDVVAMGLLRKQLIDALGIRGARAILTRFGYVHGFRLAERSLHGFKLDSEEERAKLYRKLIMLRGDVGADPSTAADPLGTGGATFLDSYEAEQHVAHVGRASEPVCWAICGILSGLLTATYGTEFYAFEDRCVAKGDAVCRVFARTRQGWGDEHRAELLYFSPSRLEGLLEESLGDLVAALREAELDVKRTRARTQEPAPPAEVPGLVVRSTAMRGVVELATRAARVDSTVLITGESGTGKECIARLIHHESARLSGPFIAINCGAIAEPLLESELFGHARGAFTGATSDRAGLFEAANAGTILLDEIGDTSPAMQTKLLRALQERVVRRIGENRDRAFDARVLAATNRDLAQDVASGRFRQDLLYRLKVIEVRIPPLRERRDDILPLARHLLAEAARRLARNATAMSARVADQLLQYRWPGNVRELANAMERSVALARRNVIDLADLPEEVRAARPTPRVLPSDVRLLDDIERDYILAALELNRGNQKLTAKQLGIGTATLYRKLKGYGAGLAK